MTRITLRSLAIMIAGLPVGARADETPVRAKPNVVPLLAPLAAEPSLGADGLAVDEVGVARVLPQDATGQDRH